ARLKWQKNKLIRKNRTNLEFSKKRADSTFMGCCLLFLFSNFRTIDGYLARLERLIHLKHSHAVWSSYIKSLSAFISKALTVYSLNYKLLKDIKLIKTI